MRDPGRRAGDREDRRERLARQADGIEQQRGIELDIGLKAAAGLAALERRDRATLHVLREGKPLGGRIEPLQRGAQHVGAWIAHAEDAVAESHQAFARGELAVEPAVDVAARRDGVEHVEREPRRAAMPFADEAAVGAFYGCSERRERGDDDARGKGRGAEAVVDHGRQIIVERGREARLDRRTAGHAQEIGRGRERRIGRHQRLAGMRADHLQLIRF